MITSKIPIRKMLSKKRVLFLFLASSSIFTIFCYWTIFFKLDGFNWKSKLAGASLLTASSTQSTAKAGASLPANVALAPKNLYDFDANLVVIYNRVPKTGSTSFVNLAYDLCKKNHFYVLHINVTANMHVLNLMNQIDFVRNITSWNEMKPALYHGHMAYLDFSKYSMLQKPIYINLIRKPLDRLVSYYYFLRYGDNFRPNLIRKKAGDKMTFDECVQTKQPDCDPKNMWLQIPFFCGHSAECWNPGSQWALDQAKQNLVNNYFLVGVTEEMEDFIYLLELSLPRIFKGSLNHYLNSSKSHLRQTSMKIEPCQDTVDEITKSTIWKMENELYEFALQQFNFLFKLQNKIKVQGKNFAQKYFYEKIRPK